MSPHIDDLPADMLDAVAPMIGERIPLVLWPRVLPPGASVEITESFRVFGLTPDQVRRRDAGDDLRELAGETDRVHHQVAIEEKPELFARSAFDAAGAQRWTVVEVTRSPVAEKIDAAISWIDANLPGDVLVRLLIAPAYHLHAFWLLDDHDESFVVVVDVARPLQGLGGPPPYPAAQFLAALREVKPVTGIRVPP
jgi:hypothetical protein